MGCGCLLCKNVFTESKQGTRENGPECAIKWHSFVLIAGFSMTVAVSNGTVTILQLLAGSSLLTPRMFKAARQICSTTRAHACSCQPQTPQRRLPAKKHQKPNWRLIFCLDAMSQ